MGAETDNSPVMNKIAIVRHGIYGSDDRLNDTGRAQIKRLGGKLKEMVEKDEKSLVLSSIATRAFESAEIIAGVLDCPLEKHEVLWSEARHPEDFPAAHQLVQSVRSRANFVILVTHLEYAQGFPWVLGKQDLGIEIPSLVVEKGQGVVINYASKSLIHLKN